MKEYYTTVAYHTMMACHTISEAAASADIRMVQHAGRHHRRPPPKGAWAPHQLRLHGDLEAVGRAGMLQVVTKSAEQQRLSDPRTRRLQRFSGSELRNSRGQRSIERCRGSMQLSRVQTGCLPGADRGRAMAKQTAADNSFFYLFIFFFSTRRHHASPSKAVCAAVRQRPNHARTTPAPRPHRRLNET